MQLYKAAKSDAGVFIGIDKLRVIHSQKPSVAGLGIQVKKFI